MAKILLLLISFVFGLQDRITLKNLENNPGMIPLKLGNAKIQQYSHTLIHYNDLNPFKTEIQKLNDQFGQTLEALSINKNNISSAETENYIKILTLTKDKTESKSQEIITNPKRIKRGLINGIGSIFKSITGNLDAEDEERYEKLIRELQNNQKVLASKFNQTVQQIIHNEKFLQEKIVHIAAIFQTKSYEENRAYVHDILNQMIDMFEIVNSALQD
ncbi:uncharacterized protein [Leptinotarsa decemlineata]|uniref:uncharacterized protein n=1 Tax=Leptinotarsa decemlineata TaxID=7539 RepID=UPI003D3054A5